MKFENKKKISKNYSDLLEPGIYEFTVFSAEEFLSKKKQPLFRVVLHIKAHDENFYLVDYLTTNLIWKIESFLNCLGESHLFLRGSIEPEDCLGKKGMVRISNSYTEKYGFRVGIQSYLKPYFE